MASYFLKLDVFRKMPKDLTESTFCGALRKLALFLLSLHLVSVSCTLLVAILCLTEFTEFMNVDIKV